MRSDICWGQYGVTEVFTAYDAQGAKEVLKSQEIAILLSDIEMPGDDGIELLRWVREQGMETECVFLTCHASFAYAQEAIVLGCQDYILMPAKYEEIGNAVAKVVQRIKNRQEEQRFEELGRKLTDTNLKELEERHGKKQSPQEITAKIDRQIHQELGNPELSLTRLAEAMYLHPVYMNRVFKKEKGVSIGQYIINERMKLAEALLLVGNVNAYAVAEQVGYQNYSNFRLAFKKYFGVSPSQYGKGQEDGEKNI